jgi:hypothetical protein
VVAYTHNELGNILADLGDLARTHYERVLELTEATIGRDHPHVATWRDSLGTVLLELGDLAGARTEV